MARSCSSLIAVAVVLGFVAVGCGSSRRVAGSSKPTPVQHIVCDYGVDYATLAQLRGVSSSVAVVGPTGQDVVRKIAGAPFTISTVTVLEKLQGARLPSRFGLRQTGTTETVLEGCQSLVSAGHVYIAFLSKVRFSHRGPGVPGQYEADGLFQHDAAAVPGDPSERSFANVSRGAGGSLPAEISISQARTS